MKFSHVTCLMLLGLGAAAGCSQGELPSGNPGSGGSGAQSGTGQTLGGTGGTTGGTGGTTGGTGGTTGGSGAVSGSSATVGGGAGMMTISGGTSTGAASGAGGSGGVATGGGSGTGPAGGGGTDPGAGGMAGGSMSGGAPPVGGAPSAGAGGSGGGGLTPEAIVPELHGFYWEGTCAGSISVEGHNCPVGNVSSCPSNGVNVEKTIPVLGTAGQDYTINIEVRGVIGTRCYTGGTRASTAALSEDGNNNWWYAGGTYANPTGWWNTYELKVTPATGDPSGDIYYFNGSGTQGGNDCEREATYLAKYNASFKAKGGGSLAFKIHDQNCKGQQNCGKNPDGGSACAPRNVDLAGMAASPPANFTQPPTNGSYRPQWMLIAVTSITSP